MSLINNEFLSSPITFALRICRAIVKHHSCIRRLFKTTHPPPPTAKSQKLCGRVVDACCLTKLKYSVWKISTKRYIVRLESSVFVDIERLNPSRILAFARNSKNLLLEMKEVVLILDNIHHIVAFELSVLTADHGNREQFINKYTWFIAYSYSSTCLSPS